MNKPRYDGSIFATIVLAVFLFLALFTLMGVIDHLMELVGMQ